MEKVKHVYSAYRYELVAGLTGASIMILELVGARLIAPYFGTSIYVWTAVIGVILGAIAIGEMVGGRWADRRPNDETLAKFITISAVLLLIMQLLQQPILGAVESLNWDIRAEALLASIVLFAPVNFFLGVVSPYLVKLKLKSLKNVGQSVGGLYAAGTIGSITGTFLAGYVLLSHVGSRPLGLSMVVVLVAITFMVSRVPYRLSRVLLALVSLLMILGVDRAYGAVRYDGDSAYARYQVVDIVAGYGQTIRQLRTDSFGVQSAIQLEDPDVLVATYNRYFYEIAAQKPKLERVLVVGGGTFTFPRVLAEKYPNVQVDVVEIDPKLEVIAEEYFAYRDHPRIKIINEDGRVFLNNNTTAYDLIFMDAFSSLSPPFQLTTTEAVAHIKRSLHDDGAVVINLISALNGEKANFLTSTLATYRQHFPRVDVLRTRTGDVSLRQNLVLYAPKKETTQSGIEQRPFTDIASPEARVLTDEYAPVERMTQR